MGRRARLAYISARRRDIKFIDSNRKKTEKLQIDVFVEEKTRRRGGKSINLKAVVRGGQINLFAFALFSQGWPFPKRNQLITTNEFRTLAQICARSDLTHRR